MNFNNTSFPHPILSPYNDDINGQILLEPLPEITESIDSYNIVIYFHLDNNDLIELIRTDYAEYYCEITCTSTLYRQMKTSNANKLFIEIPKKYVKGKIEFICALVAKTDITEYNNCNAHPDYRGFSFEIEAGDILAYWGQFSFNADIKYEKLKAVSSFMEVVENSDINAVYTKIDLTKPKIVIQLPSNDYKLFADDSISKEPKLATIFHSSIVLNAILIALYNFDTFRNMLWANVIDYRLKHDNMFHDISIEDSENIPEIAQRLLGNPYNRLMMDLQLIIGSENTKIEE
jgi:hypothetical protein